MISSSPGKLRQLGASKQIVDNSDSLDSANDKMEHRLNDPQDSEVNVRFRLKSDFDLFWIEMVHFYQNPIKIESLKK